MLKTDRVLPRFDQVAGFILELHLRTIWVREFVLVLHFGPGTGAELLDSFHQKVNFLQAVKKLACKFRTSNKHIHTASDQGILPLGPLDVLVGGIGFALDFAGVMRLPFGCQVAALGASASSSSLKATRVEVAWRALILAAAKT
jgi:hypothetical protein